MAAADIALKSGDVEIGFMDRFNGSLIITGALAQVQTAVEEVVGYFRSRQDFGVCDIYKS